MRDRMEDPGMDVPGMDPLHVPDQADVVEAVTGFVEDAAVWVAELVEDVAEAFGLAEEDRSENDPADVGHRDSAVPDPTAAGTVAGAAAGAPVPASAAAPSIEDELTAAFHDPDAVVPGPDQVTVTGPAPAPDPSDVAGWGGPAAGTGPAPAVPGHTDPLIAEVAGYNPAAADTMAFIQGVLHADPAQLNAMNAQLQGIVAQDEIHNSVAGHEAQQAADNAYHQAVQDADRTVIEAQGVIDRDPT